jgi:hypothetical protein
MLAEHAGQGAKNFTAAPPPCGGEKGKADIRAEHFSAVHRSKFGRLGLLLPKRSSLASSQTSLELIEQDFISSPGNTVLSPLLLPTILVIRYL